MCVRVRAYYTTPTRRLFLLLRPSNPLELGAQRVHHRPQVLLNRHGRVGVRARHALNRAAVVGHFGLRELEPVRGRDDDGAVFGADDAFDFCVFFGLFFLVLFGFVGGFCGCLLYTSRRG